MKNSIKSRNLTGWLKLLLAALLFVILIPAGTGAKAADVIIEPVFNQTEARSMLDSINAFRTICFCIRRSPKKRRMTPNMDPFRFFLLIPAPESLRSHYISFPGIRQVRRLQSFPRPTNSPINLCYGF